MTDVSDMDPNTVDQTGPNVSSEDHAQALADDRERLLALLADEQAASLRFKQRRNAVERELHRSVERVHELESRVAELEASAELKIGQAFTRSRGSVKAKLRIPAQIRAAGRTPAMAARAETEKQWESGPKKVVESKEQAEIDARSEQIAQIGAQFAAALERDGGLRIAGVVDDFTRKDLSRATSFIDIDPDYWQGQLEEFAPNLLFVESAWRGLNDSWYGAVAQLSDTLRDVIEWCRSRDIPTVFWAKEDPIHMYSFIRTAREFDFVFTTDIDCIANYKKILGHERVDLLPFANQPRVHNPIETHERINGLVFAGSYYRRFPERTRDFESIFRAVRQKYPFDIYDRNFGLGRMEFAFPPEFLDRVRGSLPPEQIDLAYKGYEFSLNLNTIKQSQSMFARRVYELLASNTFVVSNYSRGMVNFFGDLVVASDSGDECVRWMDKIQSDRHYADALRLAGLRKVMREHAYDDRLRFIISRVTGAPYRTWKPTVVVLASATDSDEADAVVAAVARQQSVSTRLVIVGSAPSADITPEDVDLRMVDRLELGLLKTVVKDDTDMVAFMDPDDWYGPNYLVDLALAWRYSEPDAVGKGSFAQARKDGVEFQGERTFTWVDELSPRRAAITPSRLEDIELDNLRHWVRDGSISTGQLLATDRLNYCASGARLTPEALSPVTDIEIDEGYSLESLNEIASSIKARTRTKQGPGDLTGKGLHGKLRKRKSESAITLCQTIDGVEIISTLASDETAEVMSSERHLVLENWPDGKLDAYLESTAGLRMRFNCVFLDHTGSTITEQTGIANKELTFDIPAGTVWVQFGVMVKGSGTGTVHSLLGRPLPNSSLVHIARATTLVIADQYPTHDDLYSNGFVHTRVNAYRNRGVSTEVFALRSGMPLEFGTFDGIHTARGPKGALRRFVSSGEYERYLVHFLTPPMWDVLKTVTDKPITVWIHGYEIQPWWRREYGDLDETQTERHKAASERRMEFWREVLTTSGDNVHFVLVSEHFAGEVTEDLGMDFPEDRVSIIHNPIDIELFSYQEKSAADRLNVLSIRPFANRKYANDLTVAAIQELADEPWFSELKFTIVGDGPLFVPLTEPLSDLPNVTLHRGFLNQREIAAQHRQHGVFLSPTRMDAQGVSRDEAMASGLVPVTNNVAAVPEFVDESCGFLAAAESSHELADAIRTLYSNPEQYLAMSRAAAQRVRTQSDLATVVATELALFMRESE